MLLTRLVSLAIFGFMFVAVLIWGDLVEYARVAAPAADCRSSIPLEPHWLPGFGEHRTWLETRKEGSEAAHDYLIVDLTTGRLYRWKIALYEAASTTQFGVSTRWTLWPTNWTWIYHDWELRYNCS